MPEAVACQRTEMVQDLLNDGFQEREDVVVDGPRGLVPVALGHVLEFQSKVTMSPAQVVAMKQAAALMDRAQRKSIEVLVLSAESLSGQARLSAVRQTAFVEVADMLVMAYAMLQEAGIVLRVSTRMVTHWESGHRQRAVVLVAISPSATRTAGRGKGNEAAVDSIREPRHSGASATRQTTSPAILSAAAEIGASFLVRHPMAADDVPTLLRQVIIALQSCGTTPADIDPVPRAADHLARGMKSAKPGCVRPAHSRHRRVTERKVAANA